MEWLVVFALLLGLLSLWLIFFPRKIKWKGEPRRSLVSVVIPARNEAHNLPNLFNSLEEQSFKIHECIVANDSSTDQTKAVALARGAKVIDVPLLEKGWTGKTWALQNGAHEATGDILFFLDADTTFYPDSVHKILELYFIKAEPAALSILPYHKLKSAYEALSLFFNILMGIGTDSFLACRKSLGSNEKLVGQSLVISKKLFWEVGGYEKVKGEILENFFLTTLLRERKIECSSVLGRDLLSFRMFPLGLRQLYSGWRKAFHKGAQSVSSSTFFFSIVWLFCMTFVALTLILSLSFDFNWQLAFFAYGVLALQLYWASQKLGNFPLWASLFYPVTLTFYFWVFFSSKFGIGGRAEWKGRKL